MAPEKVDLLLAHAPEDLAGRGGYAMYMAMGLFALADWLERHGYASRILHLGVEKIADPGFSIEAYLDGHEVGAVGISLHWHYQSADAIRLAEAVKSVRPAIPVVLGGFTASYFADEILRSCAAVNFVIRGDGETPLLRLMEELSRAAPVFGAVPNLSWRRGGEIVHNSLGYVAGPREMEQLHYSNFGLMEHFSLYTRTFLSMPYYDRELLSASSTFFLPVGRGCPVSCSYCGGSSISQKIINGREEVVFRPVAKVLETVRDAAAAGIDCLYVCFDPDPARGFYRELFRAIRQAGLEMSMVFECWSLPSPSFLEEFQRTFGRGACSRIVLSPDTGVERLRRRHRGFFYTNQELLEALRVLNREGIFTEVYFTYPLPGETAEDVEETSRFLELVEEEVGERGRVNVQDFGFDPGSPIHLQPRRFGLKDKPPCFADYCRRQGEAPLIASGLPEEEFRRVYGGWIRRANARKSVSRAKALKKLGRYQEALDSARKACEAKPVEWDTYMLLGSCLELAGQPDRADEVYREAMDHFPSIVM